MSGRYRNSERWEGDPDGLIPSRVLPPNWTPPGSESRSWGQPEWGQPEWGQPEWGQPEWGAPDWGPPGYEFDSPRRRQPPPARFAPAAPSYPAPREWGSFEGEDPVYRRYAPIPPGPAPERPATSLFRQVLATMRARNLITGLVLPISVAIAVGIAVVVAAGANNGSGGITPSQLPAGFPPARAATADFTSAPRGGGHGTASATRIAVNAIAASGARQVAVGSASGTLALWSSPDGGSTWSRGTGATAGALTRAGTEQLTSVANGRAGWVAVGGPAAGGTLPGTATSAPGHPVVLGSANGRAWTAEDAAATFAGPGLVTSSAAAGTSGYVIVGWQQGAGRTTGMAWFSAGLTGWQPAMLSLTGGSTRLASVTSAGTGFVAVGSAGASPVAWISPNGKAWRQVTLPLPASATSASLRYVAASGGTVAAVGSAVTGSGTKIPFAVISGDGGSTWSESALPSPVSGQPGSLTATALAATKQGYTATGTFGTPGGQDVVIWSSSPGTTGWTAAAPAGYGLSGAGAQAITALATAGSTLTGAGFTLANGTEVPTIWQSPIRG